MSTTQFTDYNFTRKISLSVGTYSILCVTKLATAVMYPPELPLAGWLSE